MDTTTTGMIGKYQVIRVLGRGGMGEVLLAQDDLGRRVAIKRPFKTALADGLARFLVEAKSATLSHPNIPVVYEMGTQEDGLPFIAMEFVEGEPLDKLISSGKQLDLILKLSIIEQVCSALGYAHEKGIIHRDIKPANVIVQPNGVAKIIDFGIAKLTNVEQTTDLTQASQIIGSLHYIAPERFKAEAVDGRVDVFSAGVMLYLLLTGSLPFAGGEATASYRIVNEAHTSLGAHIRDYPPALDGIMDQALAKSPEDRFSTAEDFADALREVIETLKRSKVLQLFDDAERLTMESRYDPALELLDEAMKLEPANTQVRKLRKLVREHQERQRRSERLRDYVVKADGFLASENYTEALAQLKEAQRVDSSSTELRDRVAFVEDKKQRFDKSVSALTDAESARNRGDLTAALRIAERAVEEDPDNTKLLAVRGAIAKQLEREAQQGRVVAILDAARKEFAARDFPAAEKLLLEAEAIDASHPNIEEMRQELARTREQEERRQLIEEIQRRVNDFLRTDNYEQAADLLTRAIDKLPTESTLHRLKMEVDTASRKFDSKRLVDQAIAVARETFAADPQKALAGLQQAIEQMPGEERLISYERSLRQQADVLRMQQLLSDALRTARESIAARQPDKAITVLETYHLEHGHQTDVDELLAFARQELSTQQQRGLIERTASDVRALVRDGRPDEALRLLESALQNPSIQESGDSTLSGLLEDVRRQQAESARKLEVVQKRAVMLRERGDLDEAIQVLKEYLATGAQNAQAKDLLGSIQAEWERKQVATQAITAAEQATQQANFPAALESLQAVVRAYGESEELTRATQQVQAARSAYAQEVITRSIETSRAALLKNDVAGAMDALRSANEMVEFADPSKQADWRRIGQAAKKAQAEPIADGATIADPLADLPEAEAARKPMSPLMLGLGIAAVCVVLAVVGILALRKPQPAAGPASPVDAHISIAKAPPGSLVAIDSGTKQATDANGSLTLTVQPGQHLLEVTMDGFDPYTEKFQVAAGETFRDSIALTKQPLASKSGTLMMQGNLAGFKVMVDGRSRGEIMKKEGTLTLEEGTHTIRYSNEDGTDTQEHTIQIAAGKSTPDTFTLKAAIPVPIPTKPANNAPAAVATGNLVIETTPNAQIAVDGQPRGSADQSGKLSVDGLPAGSHTVEISLDKYQPMPGRAVTIAGGQAAHFNQPLTLLPPAPPATGSLSIQTTAQAQVSIDGQHKGTADGSGQLNLDGLAPGRYSLEISLEHFQTTQVPVTIRAGSTIVIPAKLQPEAVAAAAPPKAPAAVDNSADIQGIQEALHNFEQAYDSRNLGRIQANWLNIGGRSKSLAGVLQAAEMVKINENCDGQPAINGNTATLNCVEISQYAKSDPPKKANKTITFAKVAGKWVMKDKLP
jgi:serine/threonine protein kinase